MAKKKRRSAGKTYKPISRQYLEKIFEAEELIERGQWIKAREMLESLNRRYPNRPEVLTHLVNVSIELQDMETYQKSCERLAEITPDDADVLIGLAGGYLANGRPALALRTFRRFLDRWPDHEKAVEIRKTVFDLEAATKEMLAGLGLSGDDAFEIAAMHEEINSLLSQGNYSQMRKVAAKLLERQPNFAPALNNLSLVHFIEGRITDAIEAAQRVLEFDSNNVYALANLTRFLCLNGRIEEARQMADRLRADESDSPDFWIKKAEAFSYLGDDEGVLDAFGRAERSGLTKDTLRDPLIYHLAAVAAMRLGREKEARKGWEKALRISPGFDLAQENIDDLSNPAGRRHAPWAFSLAYWIPRKTLDDMSAFVQAIPKRGSEASVRSAINRFLRQHPEVESLVPLLLDGGDEQAREFALRIAATVKTPAMIEALRDFGLGRRGPDEMRHKAAQVAIEEGLLPSGMVRMWWQGEWRELMLFGFEITGEPVGRHQPRVERLMTKALTHLHEDEPEVAEPLLRQALEIEPDSPSILNNLAMACMLQDRIEEALAITRDINRRHPDYVFAAVALARHALQKDKSDEAEALLQPLFSKKRFHYSELAAFCEAQIELMMAQKKPEGARSWLAIWEQAMPGHPKIPEWKRKLEKPDWRKGLFSGHS